MKKKIFIICIIANLFTSPTLVVSYIIVAILIVLIKKMNIINI